MKKILSVLLSASLVMMMFAACGSTESSTSVNASAAEASAASEHISAEKSESADTSEAAMETSAEDVSSENIAEKPAAEEPVLQETALPISEEPAVLTIFYAMSNGLAQVYDGSPADLPYYAELAKRTNVTLDFQTVNSTVREEQFQLILASWTLTDLIESGSDYFSGGVAEALESEVALDLSTYCDEYMPNYSAILASDPDFYAACVQDDGSIGGLFGFYEDGYPANSGAWIRQDYLNGIGYDGIPETYDELHEVLTQFKTELGVESPIVFPYSANWQGNYLSAGYDIATFVGKSTMSPFFQIDGTVYYGYSEENCFDYISMLNEWYSEGLVYADFVAATMPIIPTEQVDDYGCGFAGLGNVNQYAGISECEDFALTAIPAMKLAKDQVTHFTESQSRLINEATIITTECADPVLACSYYDYWYSEEGSLLLNYGVQGISWEYNEDGKPQFLASVFDNSNTMDQNLMLNAKQRGSFVVAWDRTNFAYSEDQLAAMDVWSSCDDAYDLPAVLALTVEEQSIINAKYADIETMVLENAAKFITGDRPLSEWGDFVATLDEMGLEDVIAAYQSAFDRYNTRAEAAAA